MWVKVRRNQSSDGAKVIEKRVREVGWEMHERDIREQRESENDRGNQLRAFVHMNVQAHYIIIDHRWLLFLSSLSLLLTLLSLLHASSLRAGKVVLVQSHVPLQQMS